MKTYFILIIFLLLSRDFFSASVTVTYTAGHIPTTYMLASNVTTSSSALEPGQLTVTIPSGATITSVDVAYSMTSTNGAYMSEQRSFLRCVSTGGVTEPSVSSGMVAPAGNNPGTYSYNRTNLTIANNVVGGGGILFELHAFRTYLGTGSNTTYCFVENNSWQITVYYYMPVDPPSNLSTTSLTNRMKLNWSKNSSGDNVLIAYNTSNTFGTPLNGTVYSVNGTISGGGTVCYTGGASSTYQIGLNPGTQYFYRVWSVNNNIYSTSISADAATNAAPSVSNVYFVNNIASTGLVDVYYDLSDANHNTLTITMAVSNDGGVTYTFPCYQVTGDVGTGVSTGNGKHIVWNFDREHGGVSGSDFQIRILADDNTDDQIFYSGKIYNTITIGSQIWMAENLDVGTMIQGTTEQTDNSIIEKYCYGNNPTNCEIYGALYQWGEAMKYSLIAGARGLCPEGWHLPTLAEFQMLATSFGYSSNALKASGQGIGIGAGNNLSGFAGLLVGHRTEWGNFFELGEKSIFWSSTGGGTSMGMHLYNNDDGVVITNNYNFYGYNIRCIKDAPAIIQLNCPNGGENWQAGSSHNITWTNSNRTNVKLEYTTDNGNSWTTIIASTPATTGAYNWIIPNTLSTNVKVRILDALNSGDGDTSSSSFTISSAPVPCPGTPTVTYSGKTYNTVQIGSQCWLAENLNVGEYVQSVYTGASHSDVSNNGIIEKYCYNNDITNCNIYGGLYEWSEAMQYITTSGTQGICPAGWHIPTSPEIETLLSAVGGNGNALKALGQGIGSGAGTNTSGFSALIGGHRYYVGNFYYLGTMFGMWSSTENTSLGANMMWMPYDDSSTGMTGASRQYGFSVRCLKD